MGFEELGKKLMRLGQDTKSGVQKVGESYQINSKIADEKKKLDQLYRAIGENIYQTHAQAPLEGLGEEFEAIRGTLENIADFNEQLNKVKGVACCIECGKEAVKGEKFCSSCGAKLPEVEDDFSQKMKQDAKEAVNEAGEIMGDVMEKAKVLMGSMADKADTFVKGVASRVNTRNDNVVAELEEHEVKTVDVEETAEGSAAAESAEEECMEETAETLQMDAEETDAECVEDGAEPEELVKETFEDEADPKENVSVEEENAETID